MPERYEGIGLRHFRIGRSGTQSAAGRDFPPAIRVAVPDLLYEGELRGHGGVRLLEQSVRISEPDGDRVTQALNYGRRRPVLSLPDCFALVLAVRSQWTLLTGGVELRRLANAARMRIVMVCCG